MAERRMFAKTIIESDAFNDLSYEAQALYLHLGMMADDDGFLNNAKAIARYSGIKAETIDELINARFLISFPSGVVAIKHWKINNSIKKDRYRPTVYQGELKTLAVKENGAYTEHTEGLEPNWNQTGTNMEPNWNQSGTKVEPQDRVGKESIDKESIEQDSLGECTSSDWYDDDDDEEEEEIPFPPTALDIIKYAKRHKLEYVYCYKFFDYYKERNWHINGRALLDWPTKLEEWDAKDKADYKKKQPLTQFHQFQQRPEGYYDGVIKRLEDVQ